MTDIAKNLESIQSVLGPSVTLVAVSKTKPASDIREAYEAGHRDFGENKIQEMTEKSDELPSDIQWHMIGHVQTNKIKYMAPFVHLIHGCDREKVLKIADKEGRKNDRKLKVLLQVHIAEESTKFGFSAEELREFIESKRWEGYEFIEIKGLMGMATNTDDKAQVEREFKMLKALYDEVKSVLGDSIDTLSMGMSGDYAIAINAGSNMVRIGSAIFGARNYPA
ncbi:MAG: YggS family pyridoxal phosphate-dependent enzyme [Flavobacteriia bacterium]|nr:YggS family pyridoxal phosphate-dependent enzyme [Flavobacteriia bacterium]